MLSVSVFRYHDQLKSFCYLPRKGSPCLSRYLMEDMSFSSNLRRNA